MNQSSPSRACRSQSSPWRGGPVPVFGQNLNSLFLVRCYALHVFNRNVCVCCVFCFCFVKVKFVFLSNITSFVYLRACYVFFFESKGKKKNQPTKPIHVKSALWSHFSSCVTESRPCLLARGCCLGVPRATLHQSLRGKACCPWDSGI